MTRTTLYKCHYFGVLGAGTVLFVGILAYFRFSPWVFIVLVVGCFVPGRILGFFWKDLLRGLRLLNHRDYAASKVHSERFLAYFRKQPWIRHLIWLGGSAYSRDPEVLALNNLGAAEMGLGEFESARKHLNLAIEKDALCPLPFYNLGALATAMGNMVEAERCFSEAKRLGYAHGWTDKVVRSSQTRFAELDGR